MRSTTSFFMFKTGISSGGFPYKSLKIIWLRVFDKFQLATVCNLFQTKTFETISELNCLKPISNLTVQFRTGLKSFQLLISASIQVNLLVNFQLQFELLQPLKSGVYIGKNTQLLFPLQNKTHQTCCNNWTRYHAYHVQYTT